MPVFYSTLHGLTFSCAGAICLTIVIVFAARTRLKSWLIVAVLGIFQLALMLLCGLYLMFAYKLQGAVAQPYIEGALREAQCNVVTVSETDFFIEDRYRWKSPENTASCYYNGSEWLCEC